MTIPSAVTRMAYYRKAYAGAEVEPWAVDEATQIVAKINDYKAQAIYARIAQNFQIKWWQVIGVLHYMECNFDFTKHLANGDPISADTIHRPEGIMAPAMPPYSFEECAYAALRSFKQGWGTLSILDLPSAFLFFDQWNGLGEWKLTETPGLPYLFSGTTFYKQGKYRTDGVWDPELVSKQVGVAAICRALGIRE